MKLFSSVLLGIGLVALTGCAAKGTSHSKLPAEKYLADNNPQVCTRNNKDPRKLTINSSAEGGCQTDYGKWNQVKKIAEARHELYICSEVKERVVKNLERAGFKCGSDAVAER